MQRYIDGATTDAKFMLRCIELAKHGMGYTLSNPLVGCVIVHEGMIIAEGWHKSYGGAHAEVNAIAAVQDKALLKKAILYVNLEPCVHQGKTPPCADLIIKHNIKRVVIGCTDPNPLVAGKGTEKMRQAGIEVITGVEEDACKALNAVFITYITQKRPYIILKWAQTADGYMAREDGKREMVSNTIVQLKVHELRSATQATMVGYNTALNDNPELNVRLAEGPQPIRVLLDKALELPQHLHVFTDAAQPTWVMNTVKEETEGHVKYIRCNSEDFIQDVFQHIYNNGIASVLVEGGANTLNEIISLNLWDEAWVFTADKVWGAGKPAPVLHVAKVDELPLYNNNLALYKNLCYTL